MQATFHKPNSSMMMFSPPSSSSSITLANDVPASLNWYCDAPRLKTETYKDPILPSKGSKLIHLIYVQRHHKRTPDNLVPNNENAFNSAQGWQCVSVNGRHEDRIRKKKEMLKRVKE